MKHTRRIFFIYPPLTTQHVRGGVNKKKALYVSVSETINSHKLKNTKQMKIDTIDFAREIYFLLDKYSGFFVAHSPDWKYIAVSADNIRRVFGFQAPRNIHEFDKLIDVILLDELSVDLRRFVSFDSSLLSK